MKHEIHQKTSDQRHPPLTLQPKFNEGKRNNAAFQNIDAYWIS